MSMGFERYGRILVPALRHPSFSGLRVTVRGRTQDVVALLQLIDGPRLPSLCEPEDTPPLVPRFSCPLHAVPNWFSQVLPVDLGDITAALSGPVHVISAVLAASQRLPPPQAEPVQQATTLAVRAAAPTSPVWASNRNGSLPTLTQDPERPAFQLRMGVDLGRVETLTSCGLTFAPLAPSGAMRLLGGWVWRPWRPTLWPRAWAARRR